MLTSDSDSEPDEDWKVYLEKVTESTDARVALKPIALFECCKHSLFSIEDFFGEMLRNFILHVFRSRRRRGRRQVPSRGVAVPVLFTGTMAPGTLR